MLFHPLRILKQHRNQTKIMEKRKSHLFPIVECNAVIDFHSITQYLQDWGGGTCFHSPPLTTSSPESRVLSLKEFKNEADTAGAHREF